LKEREMIIREDFGVDGRIILKLTHANVVLGSELNLSGSG
jgi:hypothetical protein